MAKLYASYCFKEWTRRMELFQRGSANVDSFWEYLDVIESDYPQLLSETSYLIAIFMMKGRSAIRDIDHKSKNESAMLLSEHMTKYIIEESKTPSGFQIGILYLVSRHPLAVAYHLMSNEELDTYGELNGLPKCLAFKGGRLLIPESKEWEPLMVLWKMWMSSFMKPRTSPITIEYLLLEYHLPKRFDPMAVMKFLDIEIPNRFDVLYTLEKLITEASGKNAIRDNTNINVCMGKMFKEFSDHISDFYWTSMLEFQDIAFHIIPRSKGAKHCKSQKSPVFFRPVSKSKESCSYQNVRKETLINSKTNNRAQPKTQDKVAFTHNYYPVQGTSSQQKALPCVQAFKVSKINEPPERQSVIKSSEYPRKLSSVQYLAIRFRSVPILNANRWIETLEQTQSECDKTNDANFQKRTLKLPPQVSRTVHLFSKDQRKDGKKSEKTIRAPSAPTRQKYSAETTLQKGLSNQLVVKRSKNLGTTKGSSRFEKSISVPKPTSCKKDVECNSFARVGYITTTWKRTAPERFSVVKGQESRNCAKKDPVKGRSQTSNCMKLLFSKNRQKVVSKSSTNTGKNRDLVVVNGHKGAPSSQQQEAGSKPRAT